MIKSQFTANPDFNSRWRDSVSAVCGRRGRRPSTMLKCNRKSTLISKKVIQAALWLVAVAGCFDALAFSHPRQDELIVKDGAMTLSLKAETPNIIRVRYGRLEDVSRPMVHLVPLAGQAVATVDENDSAFVMRTARLEVCYDKQSKLLRFVDRETGKLLLEEKLRTVQPVKRFGEESYELTQSFHTDPDEFISGTGFQQDDLINYNGRYAYLVQWNTAGVVPFLQSSRNWAILWNNTSMTELNPGPVALPLEPTASEEATLQFTAEETGLYHFSLRRSGRKFGKLEFAVGEQILISKRPGWDPRVFTVEVDLQKGKTYPVRATGNFHVFYHPPSARQQLVLRSEMGQAVDYHFIAGESADERIAGYRLLTGAAPLFPKWAYGFFQCKERYETADELLDIVNTFREKKYPLDCIVQDWRYWGKYGWNALRFDEDRFPDMENVISELHEKHAKIMISVWPNFGDAEEGSPDNLKRFGDNGWLLNRLEELPADALPPRTNRFSSGYVDMFNPEARDAFWNKMNTNIFQIGMDAWWLDATEPNLDGYQGGLRYYSTHLGPGAYWLNLYPLVHSKNIYEKQREAAPDKRVFILGRTPFAGIQHYGTTVWSGDTRSDWDTFRRQIVAGITASYSGVPYFCSDVGGFSGLDNTSPADREMYTRWFQHGAFSPIFRAHGTSCAREPWQFGEESEAIQARYLRLRYRLLPYIYSEADRITSQNGTFMRGLMMDFPQDIRARESNDSYMFGRAFLVSPVTKPQQQTKPGRLIPTDVLFDSNKQPGGLSSAYYNGMEFDELVQRGKDAVIDFIRDSRGQEHLEAKVDGTIEGLNDDEFSVRWEGYINIEKPGVYEFITAADDGVRLWVDGRLVIDDWNRQGETINQSAVTINSAGLVPVKLEYFDYREAGAVELRWQPPEEENMAEGKWPVYLPKGADWYNFWTDAKHTGGQTVLTDAPLDTLPLYVKAGSIVPMGPVQEWVGQKPADKLDIHIYPGADGRFTLYEDEGDNYNYENGASTRIPFEWDDANQTLTVGERQGSYPGMLQQRTFNVSIAGGRNVQIVYNGERQTIEL